jgi:formylglycine-generating enzyme required for sulfatase activity
MKFAVAIGACVLGCTAEKTHALKAEDATGTADADDTGSFQKTDTGGSVASYPNCEPVDGGSGYAVGEADCLDGRCLVPSGAFWMGSDDPSSCPVRQVEMDSFWIDQDEVNHRRWSLCVDSGACEASPAHCRFDLPEHDPELQAVTCVDWNAATAYCEWAGGRLPTEAEWEKAARGTDQATWAWGSGPPSCLLANYRFSVSYCFPGITESGFFRDGVSPFGLVDTVGNAWEWVNDWYDPRYYRVAPSHNPPGPSCEDGDGHGNGACRGRVLRGGAFNTTRETTRADARSFAEPSVVDTDIGFRCAYD